MTYKDLHMAFELEATSNYSNIVNKPTSKEIEYWLNIGLDKFVKYHYSGFNTRTKAFEQEQKRIDDLRTLVTELKMYTVVHTDEEYYIEDLPEDYMFLLGDRVGLLPINGEAIDCWKTDNEGMYILLYTDPIQATVDTIDQKRSNTLSDHHYRRGKAKPLRLQRNNSLYYYTDGLYMVDNVILTYLRKPAYIDIHSLPKAQYTDMPEHTHKEIVNYAVKAYLENKSNPRYQSHTNEVVI